MKHRTPVFVNILLIFFVLAFIFYMFIQNTSFFSSPYFWGTIVVLIFIYTIFGLFAIFNTNNKTNSKKSPIIEEIKKEVIEIVETDKPNSNLSQNQKLVLENLKLKVDIMNNTIEEKINKALGGKLEDGKAKELINNLKSFF